MFNRIEIVGFAFSVGVMALALYLLTAQVSMTGSSPVDQQATGLVAVSQAENQQTARVSALQEAANQRSGSIERLVIDDIVIGTGEPVAVGDSVTVHYIGTLPNGQEFDNSNKRGQPFTFTVGQSRVIPGWEEGIVGMQVGGQRILVIPADKAYGATGYGPIPGGATLVFAIELLSIN